MPFSGLSRLLPLRNRFTAVYRELSRPVYRYVLGVVGSEAEAEEIMQEAFLKLYSELRGGRTVDDPKPWVFRVAHNRAVDCLRKRERSNRFDATAWWNLTDGANEDKPSLDEDIHRGQQRARIRRALDMLPAQQRRCLELRAEGLTYRQIAAVLGLAVSSVQNHLARGIRHMREEVRG